MVKDKILICGASSFVGKGFQKLAENEGYDVELFSRGTSIKRSNNLIRGNYLEIDKNYELASNYDSVVNYAVLKDDSIQNNIQYIKALLTMCSKHGVKKLIHFSSIMVYDRRLEKIEEASPIEDSNKTNKKGYGQIKIAVDEYLESVRNNLSFDLIIVRPGFVLADGVPCPFIKHISGKWNVIFGDKMSTMPIVDRADIHKALLRILESSNPIPVYHFFPDNQITKYQYAKQTTNGRIVYLPKFIFQQIPYICAKIHIIPWSLYSRFEGMFAHIKYSSKKTEEALNFSFK